jgi:transcriptional regulator with XRE-family HTH domain
VSSLNLNALRNLRKKKKITQTQMAEALGCVQSVYQRIEKGVIKLRAEHLPIIAETLGISVQELAAEIFFDKKSA